MSTSGQHSVPRPVLSGQTIWDTLLTVGQRPRWQRLGLALVIVLGAIVFRVVFLSELGRGTAYITFYPAVMMAALCGGRAAGLLASTLCSLLAYAWVQQRQLNPTEWLALAVFVFSSLLVSILSELLHRALCLLQADIIQRQSTEAALRATEARTHAILENLGDAVLLTQPDGSILSANPAACRLFDRTEAEICRIGRAGLVDVSDPRMEPMLIQRHETGRARGELTFLRADGSRFEGECASSVFTDAAGHTCTSMVIRDLTAQRRAAEQLEQAAREWQTTFDATRDAVWLLDADSRIVRANRAAELLFGRSNAAMKGCPCWSIAHGTTAPIHDCPLARAARSRQRETMELSIGEQWYEVIVDPILDAAGTFNGAVHSLSDITARKQAEAALRETQSHYRLITENTADIIWLFDLATMRFVYVSPSVQQVRGYTQEEALAQTLETTLSPESCRFVSANLQQRLAAFAAGDASARTHTYEFGLRHKDGHAIPSEVVTTLLTDANGHPYRVVGITRDLTERHRATELQQAAIARLGLALEASQAGTWEWHLPTNRNVWSPELWKLYGLEPGTREPTYEAWRAVLLPEDRAAIELLVQETCARGGELNFEFRVRQTDGTIHTLLSRGRPFRNSTGTIEHYLGIVLDITERKQAEEDLRSHTARLQCLLRIAEQRVETVQEFLDRALAEALALTGSTLGYIYHYDEDRRQFVLNTWSKDVMASCRIANPETCYELDQTGIWGEAVRQRRPIVLNDFASAHPLKKGYPEGHAPLQRFLTVPIFDGERIVAVVGVANKPSDYGENEILQLQLLMGSVWRSVDRRRAEEALRESARFARATIDALSAHLCVLDETGTILAVNQAWQHFAEANPPTPDHVQPGANYLAICDAATGPAAADARAFAAGIRSVISGERTTFTQEYDCHSPGEQRWFVGRVTRFSGTGPLRLVVVHEAITERRQAEQALRAAHANLERLVLERTAALSETNRLLAQTSHLARVGGWEVDLRTGTNTWSGATREIHEVAEDYVPTVDTALSFYAPEAQPVIAAAVQRTSTEGEPFDLELPFVTAQGHPLWVRSVGQAYRENGVIVKLGGVFQDITERRLTEDELRRQRDQLESLLAERTTANERLRELDRLKSEFLSTMSHELRTPLNSIVGFTGILLKELSGPLNPEQNKQLGLVQSSARHLLALINDLLDLSRIESGRIELHREAFDFASVVTEVVAFLTPIAQQKALALHADCTPVALPLVGDRRRTLQILLNLATNAVKFTEHGEVAVSARVADGHLLVAVRDTGIGIRPDQLPHLFEAFRQLDASSRRHYEGTGLGLHLCKKLLRLLGGSIAVESVAGSGSTFTFTLPLAPS